MDITEAMANKKLSNEGLEDISGVNSSRIAAYKSGARGLGRKTAVKLARHLDADPDELVGENAIKRYERARDAGDREGVFKAMKSVLSVVEKHEVTKSTEANIDGILDEAVKFLEDTRSSTSGLFAALPTDEDGRDPAGKRVEEFVSVYEDEAGDDYEDFYNYSDEGRDGRGVRRSS